MKVTFTTLNLKTIDHIVHWLESTDSSFSCAFKNIDSGEQEGEGSGKSITLGS